MGSDLPDQRCIDGWVYRVNTISKATMELTAGLFTRYKRSVTLKKKLQNINWIHLPIELLREAKVNGLQ